MRAHSARRRQRGQAIVLIAVILVALFGFLGLALDGGHAYLDRRELQAAVDSAALAAAYNYMNNADYTQAQQAATAVFANNERLYTTPTCSGYGTSSASCGFGDSTAQSLQISTAGHSIAGVSFTVSASHNIPVAVMQVLGTGTTLPVSATATALARRSGTNGAAIQTLSPGTCAGAGTSLAFTGTSTTTLNGDVWSNGSISDSGQATGTVNGNVIDVCPGMPPSPLPNFTVSGSQANGWSMPDPGYSQPALTSTSQSWTSTNGATQSPGAYASDPRLNGSSCYFLAGGTYTWQAGFTYNGGFISNELRPPDEPALVSSTKQPLLITTTASLSGNVNSIPVTALPAAIPASVSQHTSYVSVGGQTFTVKNAASAGATSISVNNQSVGSAGIPSGSWVSVRSFYQFWDSGQNSPDSKGCAATFSLSTSGSDGSNPAVNSQTWAVELTAVRWSPYTVSSCSGPPSTPTCFLRESAPSQCQTIAVGNNQIIKVSVTGNTTPPDPGAQDFNVYLAPSGSCQGPFGYATQFADSGTFGKTINGNTLSGWALNPSGAQDSSGAPPPDGETPAGSGLPNGNAAAGTPPRGDLANEGHCSDPNAVATGYSVACPGAVTPGAVLFDIPGSTGTQPCLNLQGGGDIYLFSGYQYQRILLFEPGPEQQPPANTCANNASGNGGTSLIGIFYVPAASVTIVGNSAYLSTIAGGVIAWSAVVKGNGGVSISADPTLRSWPSAVRLTQ